MSAIELLLLGKKKHVCKRYEYCLIHLFFPLYVSEAAPSRSNTQVLNHGDDSVNQKCKQIFSPEGITVVGVVTVVVVTVIVREVMMMVVKAMAFSDSRPLSSFLSVKMKHIWYKL